MFEFFFDFGPASTACHSHEPRAAHYKTKRHPTIQRTNENNVPLIRMRSDFFAVMTGVSFVFTSCQRTVARDDTRKIPIFQKNIEQDRARVFLLNTKQQQIQSRLPKTAGSASIHSSIVVEGRGLRSSWLETNQSANFQIVNRYW